jgi:hypothetical protein
MHPHQHGIDENLPSVNKTKHPNKGETKLQEGNPSPGQKKIPPTKEDCKVKMNKSNTPNPPNS